MRIKEMIEPTREALDCETNSPFRFIRKCIEDIKGNMRTYIRV